MSMPGPDPSNPLSSLSIDELKERRKEINKQLKDTAEFKERTKLRKEMTETTQYLAYAAADAIVKAHYLFIEKTEIGRMIKDKSLDD